MHTAKLVEAYQKESQDRAEVFEQGSLVAIVVADGAGGTGGGAAAADYMVNRVGEAVGEEPNLLDSRFWCGLLTEADAGLNADSQAGETTAVIAVCSSARIAGASVGDSGCWLLTSQTMYDLTERQQRKPLLGSGSATPTPFETPFTGGTLLVASDGLLKYTSMEKIRPFAIEGPLNDAVSGLVDLVRLRSGALQDEVAIVLCRKETAV